MNRFKSIIIILLTTCLLLISSIVSAANLSIDVIDIGQGDSTLIITPDNYVALIDTGDTESWTQLQNELTKDNIYEINTLIITHPHSDHIGNASRVIQNYKVDQVYDNGQLTGSKIYRNYLKSIKNSSSTEYNHLYRGTILSFGDPTKFIVMSPSSDEVSSDKDLNSNSIVGQLQYNNFTMLFTGDCDSERESTILSLYGDSLKSNILKSPHHGSRTASSFNYLQAISPEVATISCGVGNSYGHPHDITLSKYDQLGIKIYRTDLEGTIRITSDGDTYQISTDGK